MIIIIMMSPSQSIINLSKDDSLYEFNKFRINYYLGNVNQQMIVKRKNSNILLFDDAEYIKEKSEYNIREIFRHFYNGNFRVTKYFDSHYINQTNNYFIDLHRYLNVYKNDNNHYSSDIEYIFNFGDNVSFKKVPVFVKAKTIGNSDLSVLLNLNSDMHVGMLKSIKNDDIAFHNKKNSLLWRGNITTGYPTNIMRKTLVLRYQNHENSNLDIKATIADSNDEEYNNYIIAKNMNYGEMLQYKFLLSIEGNDVATNLKWCLLSHSVVLMAKPTKCSWFMEDKLIPFKHYVPVDDNYSNIEEMYIWCMNNLKKCKTISKNATKYIEQFLDEENEKYVTTEVLNGYFKNVMFEN